MIATTRRRHRDILRSIYALVGIVAVSAGVIVISVAVRFEAGASLHHELERLHLVSGMLTTEAVNHAAWLRDDVQQLASAGSADASSSIRLAAARSLMVRLHTIETDVDALVKLHESWDEKAAPYMATIQRLQRQQQALHAITEPRRLETEPILRQIAAIQLTLLQLERLHESIATELLSSIATRERRALVGTALFAGLVLLVAALLVARVLNLLRERLREHERTERAVLEQERELRQSSKMEALGSLVGGVAHDFNNLLTTILGNVELLQDDLDAADSRLVAVREIQRASERAAGMTRQLLTFSRQQAVEPQVVDLNLLIRDLEPLLRRLIRSDIAVHVRVGSEPCPAEVDPIQIEQVLVNLVVNGRDAIDGPGSIGVESSIARLGRDGATDVPLEPGRYVRVRVEDSGSGMSREVRSRMFDPFFSTKPTGEGTGLGLSTVHGIVERAGGRVHVHSTVGRGTRMDVYLPYCDKPIVRAPDDPEPYDRSAGGETVLVAEDEPQVRRLVVDALRSAGYRVLPAIDGVDALRVCTEQPTGSIDLILSDVVMPGLRGPQLVEQARQHQPLARVLLMSGYAGDPVVDNPSVADRTMLRKPFKLRQLLEAVRDAVDAGDAVDAVDAGDRTTNDAR